MPRLLPLALKVGAILSAAACAASTGTPAIRSEGTTPQGLHYVVEGRGEPVVLIHGAALDLRMWDPQMDALRGRFRIVRYDLRSHGRSEVQTMRIAGYEDLRRLLDELHLERVSLVGLSAGATVATDFAISFPTRVNRLVLVSPGLGGYVPTERPSWFGPLGAALRAGDTRRAAELFADSPLLAVTNDTVAAAWLRGVVLANERMWRDSLGPQPQLAPAAIGRLAAISAPTLVIVGAQDAADIHLTAETLVRGVRGARKLEIPGAGHMVNVASPLAFNEVVVDFLRH